jgi:arylsulfatase A-like enzyme
VKTVITHSLSGEFFEMIDALDTMEIHENTLIIYIIGDNGPSAEGSLVISGWHTIRPKLDF